MWLVFLKMKKKRKLWPQGKVAYSRITVNKDFGKGNYENIYTKRRRSYTGIATFYLSIQHQWSVGFLGMNESTCPAGRLFNQ